MKAKTYFSAIRHKQRDIDTLQELLSGFDIAKPKPLAQQIALLIEGALVSAHTFRNTTALIGESCSPARQIFLTRLPPIRIEQSALEHAE